MWWSRESIRVDGGTGRGGDGETERQIGRRGGRETQEQMRRYEDGEKRRHGDRVIRERVIE
jgi:hypothetical protein